MHKLIFILLIFTLTLFARYDAYPSKECPAFNDMKHKKNTHGVHLDAATKYTVLKHHKGQNLVLIKGEQPAQRWVDDSCFTKTEKRTNRDDVSPAKSTIVSIEDELDHASKSINNPKHTKKYEKNKTSKKNLLALSWHNAFCETHRYKKECKRDIGSLLRSKPHETQFVLHGLWPQPRNNVYCNVDKELIYADKNKRWRDLPCLALDENVEDALEQVMPGYASELHKHEWVKHGTCYGTDANEYYADAINLVNQVNRSALGKFFTQNIGKQITLQQVRTLADKTFGRGAGNRVELQCKGGLVTELWLHLGSGSDDLKTLLQSGKQMRSRCQKGWLDKAGFGR